MNVRRTLKRSRKTHDLLRSAPTVLGARAIERTGGPRPLDLYHRLLTTSWLAFFGALAVGYVLFNAVFALLYLIQPGAILNAQPGSFWDAYFFSVQTMATIGYGVMSPGTFYANLLMTIEVLLGMTGLALFTGISFARFSRPTARVAFSRVAVVAPYEGVPTLMFRAANQRRNQILEATASMMVVRNEVSAEGQVIRRFHDLRLLRARTPMFLLSWTVMHPIDERSPLHGMTNEDWIETQGEVVASIVGLDGTFVQNIHARHSWGPDEIRWNSRFVDILHRDEQGLVTVDYTKFHDVETVT